jgi:DNA-binding MarR family transcriptional regulator
MTFENCICFQLGSLSRKITRCYRDKIAKFNLTHSQFFMLMAVIEFEGALPSQLAEKIDTDRATITGLIDRLERDGWVERRPVLEDRRTLSIYLSPKAQKYRDTFLSIFNEINGHFINKFSKKEWKQLQLLLSKLE